MVSRKARQGSLVSVTASGTLHLKRQCNNQRRLKYSRGQQGKSGWRGMLMRNFLVAAIEAELWVVLITIWHARVQYTHTQKSQSL